MCCFYSKTNFWPSYCQTWTDLDKILHTHGIHLWADLGRDRSVGGSRPNQIDYVFVILVTHLKSYIETTDRRDFGGKPSKWRWGRVLWWKKNPEFCSVGGARSKNIFFAFLGYPSTILRTTYRKQFYLNPWWKADRNLRYHFQWPWVTSDPDFKVMTFCEVDYKTKLLLHKRKVYLTYGMVLCLVTLTEL